MSDWWHAVSCIVIFPGVVCIVSAACLLSFASWSNAEGYTLTPFSARSPAEKPVAILFSSPTGWKEDLNPESEYAGSHSAKAFFYSPKKSPYPPYIVVSSSVKSNFFPANIKRDDLKSSVAGMWLKSSSGIDNCKKLEVFDAGPNGRLPIWLIRSGGEDCCLTVLIVHGLTTVEISALMEDEDNLQYVSALKEFARSVRFAKTANKLGRERKP
jgi:hypothetical protein